MELEEEEGYRLDKGKAGDTEGIPDTTPGYLYIPTAGRAGSLRENGMHEGALKTLEVVSGTLIDHTPSNSDRKTSH